MLESQSGPFASRVFTTVPYTADFTYPSHVFRALLLRSLRLSLPLTARACQCRRTVQHARDQGHFEAEAPPWSEQQPAFAEKLGPSHHTHPYFTSQHFLRPSHRQPTYRSHSKWFTSLGRKPVGHWHHHCFPPCRPSCTPAIQRTIRRHGTTGCAKVQRTDVPRTCPTRSLPLGRFWSWSRRPLVRRSSRVHPPTRKSQSPPEPRPLSPSRHGCPHREMVRPPCSCHLHRPCSKLVMRGHVLPQQRGWLPPTTQRNPRPRATWARCPQPNPNPLLRSMAWIETRQFVPR